MLNLDICAEMKSVYVHDNLTHFDILLWPHWFGPELHAKFTWPLWQKGPGTEKPFILKDLGNSCDLHLSIWVRKSNLSSSCKCTNNWQQPYLMCLTWWTFIISQQLRSNSTATKHLLSNTYLKSKQHSPQCQMYRNQKFSMNTLFIHLHKTFPVIRNHYAICF